MQVSTGANERQQLSAGMLALGMHPEKQALDSLLLFAEQLRKWNRSYNLVSSGDLAHLVPRHLLDSLSIHAHVPAGTLLDAGTGAGFPGLPLAICSPAIDCTLLDSAGKKIRFLRHIKRTLGLQNIYPEESRVQQFSNGNNFDTIVSRAFSSLREFSESVRHLAGTETQLLAMKGKHPEDELEDLPGWLNLSSVVQLEVPGLHAERHLVIMSVSA